MTNSEKIISVIMPAHNVTNKTIDGKIAINSTIQSFLEQNVEQKELIIIDDNSSDESVKYLTDYIKLFDEKGEISLIPLSDNRGPGGARNVGLEKAQGEYIFFLDADDLIGADSLSVLIDKAKQWGSEFILGQYTALDRDYATYFSKDGDVINAEIEKNHLLSTVGPWGKLFLNSVIKSNTITFPEKIMLYEDMSFLIKYLNYSTKNSISVSENPHYILRNNDRQTDNLTNNGVSLSDSIEGLDIVLSSIADTSLAFKALVFERLFQYRSQSAPFLTVWDDIAKQAEYFQKYKDLLMKHDVYSWFRAIPSKDIVMSVQALLENYDTRDIISISDFVNKNINKWTDFYSTQPFNSKLKETLYVSHISKSLPKYGSVAFNILEKNIITFRKTDSIGNIFIVFQSRSNESSLTRIDLNESEKMLDMNNIQKMMHISDQIIDVYVEYEFRNTVIKKMLPVNEYVVSDKVNFYKNWRKGLSYMHK
ncbi:glycosyltransferase family 2 protein [Leuconostoc carnosum]|uniref:glycosyltransferase family 2 protein n=1 Tax=Leuconostoc carnosum TaxID=1252 RepID=UPI00123B419F|nr:glycosyltransferase family 2 protein [Leuconostoc carnosum]KAA8374009.1 glycosyltransferase family 2 protein [Leuconostoc carnosum]